VLSEWREPPSRNRRAKIAATEMSVPESGSYSSQGLRRVQRISPQLDARGGSGRICPSLSEWKTLERAIVAGSREALPASGDDLKAPKDYRLPVPPGRIVVCGFDERGAMYGLYNLEQRMNPREAPFLPRCVDHLRSVTISAIMFAPPTRNSCKASTFGWTEGLVR